MRVGEHRATRPDQQRGTDQLPFPLDPLGEVAAAGPSYRREQHDHRRVVERMDDSEALFDQQDRHEGGEAEHGDRLAELEDRDDDRARQVEGREHLGPAPGRGY